MLEFNVLTIFPEIFGTPLKTSILGKAQEKGMVRFAIHDLRDFTKDRHRVTDDYPYGGGPGMVMKPEPIGRAVDAIKAGGQVDKVILTSPQGRLLTQALARELSLCRGLIIICGRYEGVDERVRLEYVDLEVSIGDYVLTGGELPALVIMDAVTRLIPGVLGHERSAQEDSFTRSLLDCPHYTRPRVFEGREVPPVLLSGDHARISQWRLEASIRKTLESRPDLIRESALSEEELEILQRLKEERGSPAAEAEGDK
jgi:tRNA (guanine37-N1)-methyltransferase